MESNTPKFRLRLNLFDGIMLVLALAVGALLLWTALKPEPDPAQETAATSSIRYVVRVQRWLEGTSSLIEEGDRLFDSIKNNELGQVVSAQAVPSVSLTVNHDVEEYTLSEVEGYEDILVTVESTCTYGEEVTLTSGHVLRVGSTLYIRGEGYMASGPVISMDREEQA